MANLLIKLLYRAGFVDHLRDRWREDAEQQKLALRQALREAKRALMQDVKSTSQTLRTAIKELATADKQLARKAQVELKSVTTTADGLRNEQQTLAQRLEAVRRRVDRLEGSLEKSAELSDLVGRLTSLLDFDTIEAHVRNAVGRATMHERPFPHVVVDEVLPRPFYELLLKALPSRSSFTVSGDKNNHQNVRIAGMSVEPTVTKDTWRFMENEVTARALGPALVERFRQYSPPHYGQIFGSRFGKEVLDLPQVTSAGRIMLRSPGYHLAPHLDPRRVLFTSLLYLARPGDDHEFGTQLYSVDRDFLATYTHTFYPEQHGIRCKLAKQVPFKANSLLAFLNSGGAHGATIPVDAQPASLERYAYQFYVAPRIDQLVRFLRSLPKVHQKGWEDLLTNRTRSGDPY